MAEDVRAAIARARAAGPALRARPLAARVDAIGALLEALREDAQAGRLTARFAEPLGFAPATFERGIALALEHWDRAALARLASAELEPTAPDPPEWVALFLAGAIPSPNLLSVVAPLVAGAPVVAKSGRFDRVTAPLVAEHLAAIDAELAGALAVVDTRSDDDATTAALCMAPCVVASGSDETLTALERRLAARSRLVGYGHRASIAVLDGRLADDAVAADEACRGLALDTALWDQLGCCSPVAAYILGDLATAEALAERLANAFAILETELPRGLVPLAARAAARHEREQAGLRAGTRSLGGGDWTVLIEADPSWRPAPLHRFLRVAALPSIAALDAALAPLGGRLSSVALAGPATEAADLRALLARHGASRIVAPGRLQAPPLDWQRDGLATLGALLGR